MGGWLGLKQLDGSRWLDGSKWWWMEAKVIESCAQILCNIIIWMWGSCLSARDIHPELVSYNISWHWWDPQHDLETILNWYNTGQSSLRIFALGNISISQWCPHSFAPIVCISKLTPYLLKICGQLIGLLELELSLKIGHDTILQNCLALRTENQGLLTSISVNFTT